jgi:transposase
MTAGRPSKYDPAYCDEIVEFCSEGYSITAFAGKLRVSRSTITEWGDVHPEFSAAVKAAKAAASLWWEEQGRRVAKTGGGPGTATMIIFNLKNTAPDDYREKIETTHSGPDGGPIEVRRIERVIIDPPDPDA